MRDTHTATLLPNGKVLVAGGFGCIDLLSSTELYDPAANTWTEAAPMATGRVIHTATLLPNGKVLVVGGFGMGELGYDDYLASAELYDPATNTWSSAGSLATDRAVHTATLLPSGKVLVVGGYSWNHDVMTSAELYDPATNTWSAAASLTTARYYHTATLLPGGKVLVAGGTGAGTVASAELYDPATNTWSSAGALATARYWHTATLLPGGQVLAAGGYNRGMLASAELYDPAANTWSAAGNLVSGRVAHSATLLPSGKVLAVGGASMNGSLASTELYDPAANTWSAAGSLVAARCLHTATLLPNGQMLVAAGDDDFGALASTELYDPSVSTQSTAGYPASGHYLHTAALLPNGKVLTAGGVDDSYFLSAQAELYNPATNTWETAGALATPRCEHTMTLLPSGKVLVAGGLDDFFSILASTELYDPQTNTWNAASPLTAERDAPTATLLANGKVLAAGGFGCSGPLASTELYDPQTNMWTPAGSLAAERDYHSAALLANGKVLVAGGCGCSGLLTSAELYDPETNTWSAAGSLATARIAPTATLLPNGKVLVAGGDAGNGNALASTELYDPETNTWSAAGPLIAAREYHTATLLPSGKVLIAGGYNSNTGILASAELYDPATNTWSLAGSLAMARDYHAATLLPSGKVLVTAGYNDRAGVLAGAELCGNGPQYDPLCQPVISSTSSPVKIGGGLQLAGSGFKGISEAASGGNNSSASNFPVVQLMSLANAQTAFLLPDPAHPWSESSFTSRALGGLPSGYALVTVCANGIPSIAAIVLLTNTSNSAPESITLSPASVAENSAAGTTAGTFSAADPDAGETFTYALADGIGGTDNASFTIAGAALNTAEAFNFEAKSSYSIRVRVTDSAGNTLEQAFTICVTDVAEAPVIASGPAVSPSPSVVGEAVQLTIAATDPDGFPLSCHWDFGDGASADGLAAAYIFTLAGDYSVTAAVATQSGVSVSKTVLARVAPLIVGGVWTDSTGDGVPDIVAAALGSGPQSGTPLPIAVTQTTAATLSVGGQVNAVPNKQTGQTKVSFMLEFEVPQGTAIGGKLVAASAGSLGMVFQIPAPSTTPNSWNCTPVAAAGTAASNSTLVLKWVGSNTKQTGMQRVQANVTLYSASAIDPAALQPAAVIFNGQVYLAQ